MDFTHANEGSWEFRRRRSARVRPYLSTLVEYSEPATTTPSPLSLLHRVLQGLRALPDHRPPGDSGNRRDDRTPLVRLIDAQKTRTVADRTPTEEIPVVTTEVSGR